MLKFDCWSAAGVAVCAYNPRYPMRKPVMSGPKHPKLARTTLGYVVSRRSETSSRDPGPSKKCYPVLGRPMS